MEKSLKLEFLVVKIWLGFIIALTYFSTYGHIIINLVMSGLILKFVFSCIVFILQSSFIFITINLSCCQWCLFIWIFISSLLKVSGWTWFMTVCFLTTADKERQIFSYEWSKHNMSIATSDLVFSVYMKIIE